MRVLSIYCFIVIATTLLSCNRLNKNKEEIITSTETTVQIDQTKLQYDKIASLVINRKINNLSDEYFTFFGKTEKEILETFGVNYKKQINDNTEKSEKESSWYDQIINYEYPDASITVYKINGKPNWIERISTSRNDFTYVGKIQIGASIQNIIEQLGAPNQTDRKKPRMIYNANNYILYFDTDGNVVKSISIAVQL